MTTNTEPLKVTDVEQCMSDCKRLGIPWPGINSDIFRLWEVAHLTNRRTEPSPAEVSSEGLRERDLTKPAEAQGLFRKFEVRRVDGSDGPGGKHEGCEYFVLDTDHDAHAPAALVAYAHACKETHPQLSAELLERYALSQQSKKD